MNPLIDELQSAIQARHIMTARGRFVAGTDAVDALALLLEDQNRDLDLIPFPNEGDPRAYVLRSDHLPHEIDRAQLISDSTPVIDLVQYFDVGRQVLFVLTGNRISGLIHLSDLNSSLCKIAFFTLVNNVERACLEIFRPGLRESLLRQTFNAKKMKDVKRRIEEMRLHGALPFDAAALYFHEALQLVREARLDTLTEGEIECLNEVRNHTAHAGHVLFSQIADLAQLKAVVRISERVLDELRPQYGDLGSKAVLRGTPT